MGVGNGMAGGGSVSRFWLSGWYFLRTGFCGGWLWETPITSWGKVSEIKVGLLTLIETQTLIKFAVQTCFEAFVRSSVLLPNLERGPCSSGFTLLSSCNTHRSKSMSKTTQKDLQRCWPLKRYDKIYLPGVDVTMRWNNMRELLKRQDEMCRPWPGIN